MKHLIWGIVAVTIGSWFLLSMVLLAQPTLGMGFYGGIFLAYGIYRIKQYRNIRKPEAAGPGTDPLKNRNIY